jgi:hypothetical protein
VSERPVDISVLRSGICDALRLARNADGGWAYHSGKRSRIEPTCWALLALGQAETIAPDFDVLRRWPRKGGWLIETVGTPPNHAFNAIAALTLLYSPSDVALAEPLVRLLSASKGLRLPPDPVVRLDSSLQGWSWVEGTPSWVEPTAWCVLLLRRLIARRPNPEAAERIRVGEQMLADRACRDGGWNYGNSNVYGQDLPPYVPTTALALLALQGRRIDAVVRGLERLERDVFTERSVMALSLAVICLRIYGRPTAVPEEQLKTLLSERHVNAGLDDDLLGLAMALYALSDPPLTALTLGAAA